MHHNLHHYYLVVGDGTQNLTAQFNRLIWHIWTYILTNKITLDIKSLEINNVEKTLSYEERKCLMNVSENGSVKYARERQ